MIGGTAAGAGNVIAFNATYGVNVAATGGTGNGILGNAIFGNVAELGIDLVHEPGVTSNDLGDGDTGANNLQNFPVLSAASTNTTDHVHVAGSLNSAASTSYEIFGSRELSGRAAAAKASATWAPPQATDANGNAVFGVSCRRSWRQASTSPPPPRTPRTTPRSSARRSWPTGR
jgi:hypothetical protein